MFYLGFLTLEPIFLVKYNENGALGSLWEATGAPRRPAGRPRTPLEGPGGVQEASRPALGSLEPAKAVFAM